jgi:HAD superfamily hydrolase (TIGR01509 family)
MLIFDCDGVLIDSEILICQIVAESLCEIGYEISTKEVIRRFAGRPAVEMHRELETDLGRPLPPDFGQNVHDRSIAVYRSALSAMPDIHDALSKIHVPICVASSSEPDKLRLGLHLTRLEERFHPNIISASMVRRGKPAPDIFIFAAGWLRTPPADCIVIEDSVAGTIAAVQAGIRVLGFTGGSHCPPDHDQRLREAGACDIVPDMHALPDVLAPYLRAYAIAD